MDHLTVRTAHSDTPRLVLAVSGEIDAASCGVLEAAIFDAVAAGHSSVDLDMGEVEFMDSSGIRVLVRFGEELSGIGGRLRVLAPSRPVEQTLSLTGLLEMFVDADATEPD